MDVTQLIQRFHPTKKLKRPRHHLLKGETLFSLLVHELLQVEAQALADNVRVVHIAEIINQGFKTICIGVSNIAQSTHFLGDGFLGFCVGHQEHFDHYLSARDLVFPWVGEARFASFSETPGVKHIPVDELLGDGVFYVHTLDEFRITWAAWFLSLCASVVGLYHDLRSALDINLHVI